MGEDCRIEVAGTAELQDLLALLAAASLPIEGLAAGAEVVLVARCRGRVAGGVALERYGEEALLRSLVVESRSRGQGLGVRLTTALLERARKLDVRRVWLLTTTAEGFFPRFGFGIVTRGELPRDLFASEELRGACPDSAVAMGLDLAGP